MAIFPLEPFNLVRFSVDEFPLTDREDGLLNSCVIYSIRRELPYGRGKIQES